MLSGVLVSSQDFLCLLPLSLEVDHFGVPFLNGSWYGIHGHDLSHERGGYSSREVSNEDVWVFDIDLDDMVLKL